MDKTLLLAATLGVGMVGASVTAYAAPADEPGAKCSVATLEGSYVYWTQGYLDEKPYASSGIMSFDGKGRITLIYSRSVERKQMSAEGTYTVAGNCSGTMNLTSIGTVNQLYTGPNGDSFTWVRLSQQGAVSGEAERSTRSLLPK